MKRFDGLFPRMLVIVMVGILAVFLVGLVGAFFSRVTTYEAGSATDISIGLPNYFATLCHSGDRVVSGGYRSSTRGVVLPLGLATFLAG